MVIRSWELRDNKMKRAEPLRNSSILAENLEEIQKILVLLNREFSKIARKFIHLNNI
jgi:hypothetical protein